MAGKKKGMSLENLPKSATTYGPKSKGGRKK